MGEAHLVIRSRGFSKIIVSSVRTYPRRNEAPDYSARGRAPTARMPLHIASKRDPFAFPREPSAAAPSTSAPDRKTIASWNVGLRGLRALTDAHVARSAKTTADAHGVRRLAGYGSLRALFSALGESVSVVCLQETKMSALDAERYGADGSGTWDGCHSCCEARDRPQAYSGVAIYWRCKDIRPVAIEEGVCGTRLRGAASTMWPNEEAPFADDPARAKALDDEGRAIWCDFGAFILCSLYAPATYGDPAVEEVAERINFKADFLTALEARCKSFRLRGRRVILCGDWNIAPSWKIDRAHEDSSALEPKNQSRDWLMRMLSQSDGGMLDAFREIHPTTKAFTCWNVASGAQLNDFGSRIDYFLCDPETLGHVEGVGVAQQLEGSDHAPVFLELGESMWPEFDASRQTPPLAMSVLYPGRQTTVMEHFASARANGDNFSYVIDEGVTTKPRPSAQNATKKRAPEAPKATMKDFFAVTSSSKKKIIDSSANETMPAVPTPTPVDATKMSVDEAREEWTNTFAKMAPPKCKHGETCKIRVVKKKESENFGRVFFCCPRPAGPRSNPECDCGFFVWREARRNKT